MDFIASPLSNLKAVRFQNCNLQRSFVLQLAGVLPGSGIEALGLPRNAEALIDLGDGRELSNAISVSPSLTCLNLSFCGIRREAGAILAANLGSSNVTYLDDSSNGLGSGIRPTHHSAIKAENCTAITQIVTV
jgi:hypothetical protein